jgi:hypothetical protein
MKNLVVLSSFFVIFSLSNQVLSQEKNNASFKQSDTVFIKSLHTPWKAIEPSCNKRPSMDKPLRPHSIFDSVEKLTNIDMLEKVESFKKIKINFSENELKTFSIITFGHGQAGVSYLYQENESSWDKIHIPSGPYDVKEVCGILGDSENIWIRIFTFEDNLDKTYNYNLKTKEFVFLWAGKYE